MGDADLVALAAGGDRDAFAALYDRHAPAVHDYLRRMLGNPHDAADALQDTFIAAGTRIHQLRDPTKVRAWLYAIARRHAYRTTAARRRTDPLDPFDEGGDVTAVEVDPTDALADEELRTLIDAAAEGLDERDRTVLELHFRHGLSGDELAAAIGVERGNAHVLVHRVKERLQTSLGALVVARHGRSACPELASLLGAWDGRLTTVLRKRVARHAEGCATCETTMGHGMKPAALLGLVPLAPLPAGAREAVLERVELCSYTGEPWPGEDGFPPADDRPIGDGDGSRRRASRTLVGAIVALIVVLLAGSVVLADADPVDHGQSPAGAQEESTTTERRGTTGRPSSTATSSSDTTATTAAENPGVGDGPPTTRRPRPPTTRPRPGSTTPPATEPTTAPTSPPTTQAPTTTTTRPPTTTTRPPTTTTPTTRPPMPTTTQPPPPTTTTTFIIIG